MKKYELLMILEQSISEEALNSYAAELTGIVSSNKGEVSKSESLGVKELATPINKQKKGHYFIAHFTANNAILNELENKFKVSERLLRHMIVEFDSIYSKSA